MTTRYYVNETYSYFVILRRNENGVYDLIHTPKVSSKSKSNYDLIKRKVREVLNCDAYIIDDTRSETAETAYIAKLVNFNNINVSERPSDKPGSLISIATNSVMFPEHDNNTDKYFAKLHYKTENDFITEKIEISEMTIKVLNAHYTSLRF